MKKKFSISQIIKFIGLLYVILAIIISNFNLGIFSMSKLPILIIPGIVLIFIGIIIPPLKKAS